MNGIRDLAGIKCRCRINEETGCWEWALSYSGSKTRKVPPVPRCHVTIDGVRHLYPAGKAAWLLSGRELPDGHIVWRTCWNYKCCNPKHLKAGTMKQMGAALCASGVHKGHAHRKAVNIRNNAVQTTPAELVRKGEAMFERGATVIEVAQEIGVHKDTANRIARGTHRNSTGRQALMSGASVFAWAV